MLRRFVGLMVAGCCALVCPVAAEAGVTYFLVAERPGGSNPHNDSFVVPMDDAKHVAHARDLIARGPDAAGEAIVFAEIARGSGGGINRDLLSPTQREWNWHVADVVGFGDFGIEILDGWPTYVHENLDQWLDETGPNIGFWGYTVVRELPAGYDGTPGSGGGTPPAVPLPPAAWVGGMMLGGMAVKRWRAARQVA